ncbi:hypothetical protein FOXB_04130 [Fusarium oxysporum f. sp. conglutinans Fo5176]|uniref:Uncharacterized protein n=1 Tax=Fusarium oxysporum (strain Fo5176) TaxID=660025 RepID=F9FCK2_FUSOF|nr:hypothetical protein FOXB_04130 [Fusarium oxysporum f. sp. conglutinans Fo5176]
MPQTHQRSL